MNIEDIRQARAAAVLTAATLLKSIGMVAMNLITEGVADPDDYLDINMVMDEAMEVVLGRPTWMGTDVEIGACTEEEYERDVAIFNRAYAIMTRKKYFLG